MNDPRARYLEFLQERGKRASNARLQVLDAVSDCPAEFTAEELTRQIQDLPVRRISRPTVYRTCKELADAGLLWTNGIVGEIKYYRAW